MNVSEIRCQIEAFTANVIQNHPFALSARFGRTTRDQVATYLFNLGFIFTHTPRHLEEAAGIARERGESALALYLENKIAGEIGHEKWAEDDLEKHASSVTSPLRILPEAERVMDFVQKKLREDPANYLYYMTFVEYFTVLGAPVLLKDLHTQCGIPPSEMTAILNHQVSDRDHIEEDFAVLSELGGEKESQAQAVIKDYGLLISEFLVSCLTPAR